MTLERVKAQRRKEALAAAEVLGAEVEFFDCGDYPMHFSREHLDRLVDIYRSLRPSFVLTHPLEDPYNFDHPLASHVVQEARIVASPRLFADAAGNPAGLWKGGRIAEGTQETAGTDQCHDITVYPALGLSHRAKLEILGYYCPASRPGCLTFRWTEAGS